MDFQKIVFGVFLTVSSLLAIDTVSNISVSAPHNTGTITNDSSVDFTWTPPSGVSKYYYKLDTNSSNYDLEASGDYTVLNSSSATSLTATVTQSGNYYLHILAVDSNSQVSAPTTKAVSSEIDIDAPGAVSFNPDSKAISEATTISISGSESDIYYTTDGSTPTTSSQKYSSGLLITIGMTLKAIQVDNAGNTGVVSTATYTSTVQPTIKTKSDSTAVDGRTFATKTTAGASTSDIKTSIIIGGTGFTRYKYKYSTESAYTTVATTSTVIDISGLSSGSYTLEVLGGDPYNYKSESNKKSVTFTVDNTAPTNLTIKYDSNSTKTIVNPDLSNENGTITLSADGSSEIRYAYGTNEAKTY